ncbi:SDR family NAD(P)-dependent oxidoreductase [uncultured Megasphaera sp.]|jgi:NAD(P)-dependent dehydrogenase (short-subunit alcohol dehydrogenase family)|uniref:SDR family NAD(P)-dependent oxidoreductase n=1 Tax=uncultured Megasphaera sp. TaxID=165188 RepID=UPI00258B9464|nr:SDR family oxidoreductase [uncultured Megasphaera sp.]
MDKRFAHKTALVTGAGTGIGRAVAQRFAQEGAEVLILGRTEATLQETAAANANITYSVADLEKEADLDQIVAEIKQRYGKLDILVNNAGWAPVTPFSEVKMEEYDKVFSINVRALVNMTLHVLPLLKASRGNIINMSSVICKNHLLNMSMYAGTKAAVEIFTKIWAKELAPDGVRVNAIGVGSIETPIYGKTELSDKGIQEHIEKITRAIPQGHFGKPEDIAAVAAFLASDEANFVTGSEYGIDGGFGA